MTGVTEEVYEAKAEVLEPKRRRLQPYNITEVLNLPPREYLVKGLLDRQAMSVLFGPSNCGKTFVALDIALHIVFGWPLFGLRVRQGAVFYIAAEGGLGLRERLTAFEQHHEEPLKGAPLWVLPARVNLCDSKEDAGVLIEEINRLASDLPVDLVVVDTLSRTMMGGNENSPDDMGSFVSNCDRIRQETNAHVLVIHHSGKDEIRGSRGHSSLLAAIDTELQIAKNDTTGTGTITIRKQRDGARDGKRYFRLLPVELGLDDEGDPITSCVVVVTDATGAQKEQRLTDLQQIAFDVLVSLADAASRADPKKVNDTVLNGTSRPVPVARWRDEFYARAITDRDIKRDSHKRNFQRASNKLITLGKVGKKGNDVWVIWPIGTGGT